MNAASLTTQTDTKPFGGPKGDRVYLLVVAAHAIFGFFGFLNGFQHFHSVQLLFRRRITVQANLKT